MFEGIASNSRSSKFSEQKSNDRQNLPNLNTPIKKLRHTDEVSSFLRSVPSIGSMIFRREPRTNVAKQMSSTSRFIRMIDLPENSSSNTSIAYKTCDQIFQAATQKLNKIVICNDKDDLPLLRPPPKPFNFVFGREYQDPFVEQSFALIQNGFAVVKIACSSHELPINFAISSQLNSFELSIFFDETKQEKKFDCVPKGRFSLADIHENFQSIEFRLKSLFDDSYKLMVAFGGTLPTNMNPKLRKKQGFLRPDDSIRRLFEANGLLISQTERFLRKWNENQRLFLYQTEQVDRISQDARVSAKKHSRSQKESNR